MSASGTGTNREEANEYSLPEYLADKEEPTDDDDSNYSFSLCDSDSESALSDMSIESCMEQIRTKDCISDPEDELWGSECESAVSTDDDKDDTLSDFTDESSERSFLLRGKFQTPFEELREQYPNDSSTMHDIIKALNVFTRHAGEDIEEDEEMDEDEEIYKMLGMLKERCWRNPEQAREYLMDENPWDGFPLGYPLHALCSCRNSLSSVRALIAAYPEALKMTNEQGYTPLTLIFLNADTHQSHEKKIPIFRTVLYACPEAAKVQDNDGDLPIQCIYRCSVLEMIWDLLLVYPEAVNVKGLRGRTPLQFMTHNSSTCMGLGSLTKMIASGVSLSNRTEDLQQYKDVMGVLVYPDVFKWAKTQLLLMAGHYGRLPVNKPSRQDIERMRSLVCFDGMELPGGVIFRSVHASAATSVHPDIVELAITTQPHQVKERDEEGRLPLHLVSSLSKPGTFWCQPCMCVTSDTFQYEVPNTSPHGTKFGSTRMCKSCYQAGLRFALGNGADSNIPVSFPSGYISNNPVPTCYNMACNAKVHPIKPTFDIICEAYPEAAKEKNNAGRLPLHELLISCPPRIGVCVDLLLSAFPGAVDCADPITGMLPLHAVALHKSEKDNEEEELEYICALYLLLCANPGHLYE